MPVVSFDEYMNESLKDMEQALPYLATSLVMFENYGDAELLALALRRFLKAHDVPLKEYKEQIQEES